MFGWHSSAEIRASSQNICTNLGESDLSGRMRLTTNVRSNPWTPWATALNTSAIPPLPIRSRSWYRPKLSPGLNEAGVFGTSLFADEDTAPTNAPHRQRFSKCVPAHARRIAAKQNIGGAAPPLERLGWQLSRQPSCV